MKEDEIITRKETSVQKFLCVFLLSGPDDGETFQLSYE